MTILKALAEIFAVIVFGLASLSALVYGVIAGSYADYINQKNDAKKED